MSPDLSYLRKHVEPQLMSLHERVHSSLDVLETAERDPRLLAALLVLGFALLAAQRVSGGDT